MPNLSEVHTHLWSMLLSLTADSLSWDV
jgi:hypothetical protein